MSTQKEEKMDVSGEKQMMGETPALAATRACLFILGMHRSGTSAVCGALHQLGAERPQREMPSQPDNPKGFFEPIEISAIHDRILASAGLYWFDWEAMPRQWHASAASAGFVDELCAAVAQDFPGEGPFLLKDPRVCRFADIWLEVLKRLSINPIVVVQYRHPLEVAQSLKVRDGFPIGHGLLMWLRHVIEAEKSSRSTERVFCDFDNLLIDWRTELYSVIESPGVRLPKRSARAMALAGDFLDSSMRHHARDGKMSSNALHEWIVDSFEALQRLRSDPYDTSAMASLDGVRDKFDAASAAFSPAFQQLHLHVESLRHAADRTAAVEAQLESSRRACAAIQLEADRIPGIETDLEAARQALQTAQPLVDRIPVLEAELENSHKAHAVIQAAADRVPGLEAKLEETRQEHATQALELESSRSACAAIQLEADRVPALETDLEAARQALQTAQPLVDRIPVLEAELDNAHKAHSVVQVAADRVPGLEAKLEETQQELATLVADKIPNLEFELESSRQLVAASKSTAERVPGLETALQGAREMLADLQRVADRVPDLEEHLANASQGLASAQQNADRVSCLEMELAAASTRIDEAQNKLASTTRQLDRTIGRRLRNFARRKT